MNYVPAFHSYSLRRLYEGLRAWLGVRLRRLLPRPSVAASRGLRRLHLPYSGQVSYSAVSYMYGVWSRRIVPFSEVSGNEGVLHLGTRGREVPHVPRCPSSKTLGIRQVQLQAQHGAVLLATRSYVPKVIY